MQKDPVLYTHARLIKERHKILKPHGYNLQDTTDDDNTNLGSKGALKGGSHFPRIAKDSPQGPLALLHSSVCLSVGPDGFPLLQRGPQEHAQLPNLTQSNAAHTLLELNVGFCAGAVVVQWWCNIARAPGPSSLSGALRRACMSLELVDLPQTMREWLVNPAVMADERCTSTSLECHLPLCSF